jgi:acetyl/propionyl-CoA carboxylase alpha subunit
MGAESTGIGMMSLQGKRIAIANRGEIAVRIAATCVRLGAIPIALLGEPDRDSFAARQIGRVEIIGPAGSELDVAAVIDAAKRARADMLHPGYGFLSERPALSAACAEAGIIFAGPSPETLQICGDKLATRQAADRAGAPVLPASELLPDDEAAWPEIGESVGYPLLVKPSEAGGGRGLRRVASASDLIEGIRASRRESIAAGAGTAAYLERELIDARHVEVQIVADRQAAFALGDRDCSLQRRSQKVIEEAPAPGIPKDVRLALHRHACRVATEVGLQGIATCEFLLGHDGTLAFLEVNPRIQVEHPVTEMVTGVDLVEWQLRIAIGETVPFHDTPNPHGHAVEARIYAEDPARSFYPAAGTLATVSWPVRPDTRVDAGYATGDTIPESYDAMLAKIITHGPQREAATAALRVALTETIAGGLPTNISWLLDLLADDRVRAGAATTQIASQIVPSMPDRFLALLAAVAQTLDRSQRETSDPWAAIGPFRASGDTALVFHGDDWEERISVQRSGHGWITASADRTARLQWWRDAEGIWTITSGDQTARFAVIDTEHQLEISGHGGRWIMHAGAQPPDITTNARQASDGRVRAPLPGRVQQVHVAPGDQVSSGEPLVTLNARKMEFVCHAPGSGVVATVACQVDDQVAADDLLVTLDLEPSSPMR